MIIPLLIYIIIVLNMQSFVLMMYFHTVLVAEHKHLSLNLECGKMSDLKGLFNQNSVIIFTCPYHSKTVTIFFLRETQKEMFCSMFTLLSSTQ